MSSFKGEVPRVMSLRAPDVKMSKSDPSEFSRINLTGHKIYRLYGLILKFSSDTRDEVYAKIRKAVTDSMSQVTYDPEVNFTKMINIPY